jgi:hypothetical protein
MDSDSEGRCGEVASDLSIIVVTVVQAVFFTFFYEYIAWPVKAPNGSVTWVSLVTDEYFQWLPFVIAASTIVVVVTIVMMIYNRAWFRRSGWILFSLLGITMTLSLLIIFPFDFSVIPNDTVAELAPTVVTVVLLLMAAFYAGSAVIQLKDLRKITTRSEPL